MMASQPELFGIPVAFGASFVSMLATYLALYLLDQRYEQLKLFKVSVYQLLIFLPLAGVSLFAPNNSNSSSQMDTLYIIFAVMMLLLFFLAYTNYKMAKKLGQVAKLSNNMLFKYSSVVLLISAYTMPFIIGLIFFAVALVLFLIGCVAYKDVVAQSESQV